MEGKAEEQRGGGVDALLGGNGTKQQGTKNEFCPS